MEKYNYLLSIDTNDKEKSAEVNMNGTDIKYEKIHQKVLLLVEFYNENKRKPKQKEKYKGEAIGILLKNIKSGNTKITKEDRNLLISVGYNLESINKREQVHEKIKVLLKYYTENGREPNCSESYNGIKIGQFFYSINTGGTHVSKEDKELLKKAGLKLKI